MDIYDKNNDKALHELSLEEYEELLTDLPLLNGHHQVWSLQTWNIWNAFPQIEYDTSLYRSKRQAGEVTYEYDRWVKMH